jgi:molecular chaperone HscB
LRRAAYLCELRGTPVDAERNTAMPGAFLMQQMTWREALEEAADAAAAEHIDAEVEQAEATLLADATRKLDIDDDPAGAAADVRALMFIQRFRESVQRRLDALDPTR